MTRSHCTDELERHGLLLKQDKAMPSVASLIAGGPIQGSWWGHPKSHEIFHELEMLADHPDVLITKLVAGKDTVIHRQLWPAFISVALGGQSWQRDGLSADATQLLQAVESAQTAPASGEAARDLVERLLVHGTQVHTTSGRHELVLETWSAWIARTGFDAAMPIDDAIATLEQAVERLGGSKRSLPWHRFPSESKTRRGNKRQGR